MNNEGMTAIHAAADIGNVEYSFISKEEVILIIHPFYFPENEDFLDELSKMEFDAGFAVKGPDNYLAEHYVAAKGNVELAKTI